MEAIILAGGLGTRLRSEVSDRPKSMALIGSRPFLEYQMDLLISMGITRFILSVGYKAGQIRRHIGRSYRDRSIIYALEEEPLGTGGAISFAMQYVKGEHVVVVNGDSLYKADLQAGYSFHRDRHADMTLLLKSMKGTDRYGTVELDDNGRIIGFREKQHVEQGLINGGIYLFDTGSFRALNLPDKYSVEKDLFATRARELAIFGYVSDGYFLDIGIPADLARAQFEIGIFPHIDKSWTLFIDRDGVINRKLHNDYVKSIEEFDFLPGALDALKGLSGIFDKIIIVTNQQGIGKGKMTEKDLHKIHAYMMEQVNEHGGRIDAVYYAPQLESEGSPMRKPGTGMARRAKEDFPTIDFSRSIMAGDSPIDLEFGERAGMVNVLVSKTEEGSDEVYTVSSLREFYMQLKCILSGQGS